MSPTRHAALQDLLQSLFGDGTLLREFLRRIPDGAALLARLPAPSAALVHVVFETVGELERRGMLDARFFTTLAGAFPRMESRIRDVASLWGVTLAPPLEPGLAEERVRDVAVREGPDDERGDRGGRSRERADDRASAEDALSRLASVGLLSVLGFMVPIAVAASTWSSPGFPLLLMASILFGPVLCLAILRRQWVAQAGSITLGAWLMRHATAISTTTGATLVGGTVALATGEATHGYWQEIWMAPAAVPASVVPPGRPERGRGPARPRTCPPDMKQTDEGCAEIASPVAPSGCPADMKPEGPGCVPRCPEDQLWTGSGCEVVPPLGPDPPECPADTKLVGGRCVRRCPGGQKWTGQGCEAGDVVAPGHGCPEGQKPEGQECVPNCRPDELWVPGEGCRARPLRAPPSCPKGMALIPGTAAPEFVDDRGEKIRVDDVCIDITEVTVGAYARCVAAGACAPASSSVRGSDVPNPNCNADREERRSHPLNCVDRSEAATYCGWAGKRLPTEWEWQWAARGRDEWRTYPWGDEPGPTCARAIMIGGGKGCGKDGTWPVGSKPGGDSRDGLKDMAGNVFEWTSSGSEGSAIMRGGAWNSGVSDWFRAHYRATVSASERAPSIGFRCARAARP